ncbi:uncharacterized protein LOC144822909 isoform X2 [Lissotriton helveticus]
MENRERSGKNDGLSKKQRKKWKTFEKEMLNLSELCSGIEKMDRENYRLLISPPDNDIFLKKNKKAKINKALNLIDTQNNQHHKKRKRKDYCTSPNIHASSAHVKVKKAKKSKHRPSSPIVGSKEDSSRDVTHRPEKRSPKTTKKIKFHGNLKGLQAHLYNQLYQSSDFNGSRNVLQVQGTCLSDIPNKTIKSGKETSNLKQRKMIYKDIPVCGSSEFTRSEQKSCSHSIEPMFTSSPADSEMKIVGIKRGLTLEFKEKILSPVMNMKNEEPYSNSDHSQDLFITQKSFLPVPLSNAASSSLQINTVDTDEDGSKPTNLADMLESSSLLPSMFGKSCHPCHISQGNVASKTGHEVLNLDKATQTDGFYNSSGLASSLGHTKKVVTCSEQPLDLSLPFRARSVDANIKKVKFSVASVAQKDASESLCITSDRSITTKNGSEDLYDKGNTIIKQLRKMDEGKYFQTQLNSSYFFKGKDTLH